MVTVPVSLRSFFRSPTRCSENSKFILIATLDADDRELAYLSDTGGHGNVWVRQLKSGETRQITFEKMAGVVMGTPIWSPDGKSITFVSNSPAEQGRTVRYLIIRPDGSDSRIGISQALGRPGPAIASGFITPSGRPRGQPVACS